MDNPTPEEVERERIFSNDKDPMDELNELRLQEAEEANESSEESAPEEEETSSEEGDELDAFTEEEEASEDSDETEESSESEESEQEGDEESEKSSEEEAPETPAPYKFKANGQDFEFTQQEINDQFGAVFGKAMDYTRKMQKIAPYRKMVSALEDEGIDQEQLNLAIDVLKGDKGALQKLIAEKSIDIYDLDVDGEKGEYQTKDYGKNENELDLEEVTRQISADPEYSQTLDVVTNQWDNNSRQALANNPEWLSGLHSDVKSGVFAKVAPEATKMKMLDGGSKPDIEYYLMAGQQLFEQQEQAASKQVEDPAQKAAKQYKDASATANKKRSASSTRSRGGRKGVVDYLDDNDEKFDEWYDTLMENQ